MKLKTFSEFSESGHEILKVIKSLTNELQYEITKKQIDMPSNKWKALLKALNQCEDEIKQAMTNLSEITACSFEHHLAVELYRRDLFLNVCKFKVMVDNTRANMREFEKNYSHIPTMELKRTKDLTLS